MYIVTNGGDNGEGFVKEIRIDLQCDHKILVYCMAVDYHSKWAGQYSNITVTGSSSAVHSFMDEPLKNN